ncbi:MAG: HlyD family efflux transporter periplasmic adaptor subunit, partial [Opitutales bacterium]
MKSVIFIVTFVAILSGVGWWAWKGAAPLVKVTPVLKGNVKHSSPGRVEVLPQQAQQLRSLRNGIVRSVIMTPNSASRTVSKGDVIIQLDTLEVELSLQDIRASLSAAEARLEAESDIALQVLSESRDLEDYRKLAEEGRYPKADLRKREDAVKRLQAQLALEKIALKEQAESYRAKEAQTLRHLDELTIKSPFGGILTEVFVSTGEHVFAGNPLGILQSRERLVKVAINEEDYQGVEVGQSAAVHFLSHGSKVF